MSNDHRLQHLRLRVARVRERRESHARNRCKPTRYETTEDTENTESIAAFTNADRCFSTRSSDDEATSELSWLGPIVVQPGSCINGWDYFSISSGCTLVITSSKCSMEMARPMWPLLPWTVVAFSKEFMMASSTDSIAA